uniref:Glycosyltransferase n=1 Tax=Leersia perrieri TaxID=77586 RepID=A0A0D9WX90_9ORYZ
MPRQERAPDAGCQRVVLFPLPYESHLSPMLQLAALLHARGLDVTVLHTDFNAPDPARHPDLTFVSIRESLPEEAVEADIIAQLLALNAACEAPFRDALASLQPGVACAIVDGEWYAALGAAAKVGVPALALMTESAATSRNILAFPRLRDAGYEYDTSKDEQQLDELVPRLEPLRVRDLIRVDGWEADGLRGLIVLMADAMRSAASGVILNTFDAIEASELEKIQAELSQPTFAVGPLHRVSPAMSAAERSFLHVPDRSCLAWLDAQPPRSVLYVSLGSMARVDRVVFDEMAWGLAHSSVPFLLVARPGLANGINDAPPPLPEGLTDVVGIGNNNAARGKVVTWAPQKDVLAHPAIGGFWTHCGWNSTLESICEGVPMLAQPCLGDQTVSARYITHQWGVALELGEVFDRVRVAEAARKLMVGEEGSPSKGEGWQAEN